ncbi:tetratricopeptide repeat protein [Acanthopleuribacter pedis]|uniref:Tetratricopeptide repeat protein n=1 Tax=Acanthopleuribacter pedis TaxID=442870 RepID=A0A8J7QED0_9BACT|nr:tetratricopeptide repeat protein [Acanthopleuribacter pedis]MBO1318125.1 hypothetical protein [Acanthopleuribacter pedis]
MLTIIETHKVDPAFEWLEVRAADEAHEDGEIVRLVVDDAQAMVSRFVKRYVAKRDAALKIPDKQVQLLEEFFEEACMAKAVSAKGLDSTDLPDLLPTTVIHFKYPERTTFRKSRAARVKLFLDQALSHISRRDFAAALGRLDWVHHLDPDNELAFELKIVALRSWRKAAECVAVFEAYVAAHPDKVEPRLGLSEIWLYLDNSKRARETLERILEQEPNHPMALVGLAQARCKLGEDPTPELRRAWLVDMDYTREMVEEHFDFRETKPENLAPRTLQSIAKHYHIPLKRILKRAKSGVLPMHPPTDESGLFQFTESELDRYYNILKTLGLEIPSTSFAKPKKEAVEAEQPSLFDDL